MKNNTTTKIKCSLTAITFTAVLLLHSSVQATTNNEQIPGVRPVSAPYFNEDSYITSDLRAWYLTHSFYGDTLGGSVSVAALQVRLGLTENLQLVAYKDGYTKFDNTLNDEEGWNDIGAGLKWAFYQNWEKQLHVAAGIGYEFALGDDNALQDTTELRLWVSVNKAFKKHHFGATLNYQYAGDTSEGALGNADLLIAHLHYDYELTDWLSLVTEINGYFVLDGGAGAVPFSGVDAVSVAGGEDEDTITGAIGVELRPFDFPLAIRGAYETELTDNVSLFGHRWTFSAVYTF